MSKRTKNSESFTNLGLSSLMVVFLVLCLTTFALLTLSTAKNDYSLSEKMAAHRTDYYAACTKAEVILNELDSRLENECETLLTDENVVIDDISISYDSEQDILSYAIPLENGRFLSVRLRVTDPSASDTYYEIVSWQVQE